MDFGLLGPLVVRDRAHDVPVSAPRQRVLLAALLLSADRVVSLDALAETLWETGPPAGARGALHSAVQRLRSALGPSGADLIETRPPGYLMKVGDGRFDVREFGVLAGRGHAAAEAGNWAQAASLLREALGLWRGEPLADIPSQLLRDREVPPVEDQRLRALTARIDADMHLRRHAEVVPELRQLVAAHPLREQFHAQLMLSLYRVGRQADALAAYQDVRQLLADRLGLDPGPELRLLHQRILAADSELLIADAGHALAWFEAERPVLIAAAERALEAGFDTHAWQIPWALSRFLDVRGRWHDWAAIEQVSLAAAQRLGDRAAQASAHQRYGTATAKCGNYADAHAHLEVALGICAELEDHAGLANVHNCLAVTLNYQGCYREALGHAQQALRSYTVAGDLPGQAMALNSVGWFHVALGDYEQALGSCQQALGLFRGFGSREGVANALDSLGYVHQHLGSYAEASACYQEALCLQRELGGRWGEAEALGHLGDTQHAAGDPAAARAAWKAALAILGDIQHPDAAAVRAKLAAADPGNPALLEGLIIIPNEP